MFIFDEYLTVEEKGKDWNKTNVYLAIGVKAPEYMKSYDDYLIRFMPNRDDKDGALYVPCELAEGTKFYMTRRDHDKIGSGRRRWPRTPPGSTCTPTASSPTRPSGSRPSSSPTSPTS